MTSQGSVTSIQTCEASPSEECIGCLVSMQRTFVGRPTHETGQMTETPMLSYCCGAPLQVRLAAPSIFLRLLRV